VTLPNVRLKLTGLLLKESSVASPGGLPPGPAGPLRPRTRRPQLKRDPLGCAWTCESRFRYYSVC